MNVLIGKCVIGECVKGECVIGECGTFMFLHTFVAGVMDTVVSDESGVRHKFYNQPHSRIPILIPILVLD